LVESEIENFSRAEILHDLNLAEAETQASLRYGMLAHNYPLMWYFSSLI
jgi:hypothetical protein